MTPSVNSLALRFSGRRAWWQQGAGLPYLGQHPRAWYRAWHTGGAQYVFQETLSCKMVKNTSPRAKLHGFKPRLQHLLVVDLSFLMCEVDIITVPTV